MSVSSSDKQCGSTVFPEDGSGSVIERGYAKPKAATTWAEMLRAWPKTTFLIVGNEFCERFSYYGMRAVLTLYFLNILRFSANASVAYSSIFSVLNYATPLLGSILADGYIGKFKTIFILSILHAIGNCMLAGASTAIKESPLHPWLDFAGLFVVAVGTGGIKPCVSAFGGDQFEPHQERMLGMYFSVFYFSINAGSMISTVVTPIFRSHPCLGQDSCYPLAFGVPAALMILATVLFIAGSFWYKKPPPKENIFGEVFRLGAKAISNKVKSKRPARNHWLEYFLDTHDCQYDAKCVELKNRTRKNDACQKRQLIEDVRSLLRLLIMFLPMPAYWCLYDGQAGLAFIQSLQMDGRVWGEGDNAFTLLPDQMSTFNAVLILVMIPFFQASRIVVYPLASLCVEVTPLRKMVAGGVVSAMALGITAVVQLQVNPTLPNIPPIGRSFVSFVNGLDGCGMTVNWLGKGSPQQRYVPPRETLINHRNVNATSLFDVPAGKNAWEVVYNGTCDRRNLPETVKFETTSTAIHYVSINSLGAYIGTADPSKPTDGNGDFSLGIDLALSDYDYAGHLALCRVGTKGTTAAHPCDPTRPDDFYFWEDANSKAYSDAAGCGFDDMRGRQNYTQTDGRIFSGIRATQYAFKSVRPGNWSLYYLLNTPKCIGRQSYNSTSVQVKATGINIVRYAPGGVYLLVIDGKKDNPRVTEFQVVSDNVISILWQVPQIVTLTAAEVLFSITGYEFAYTQCAPSMKALVQAAWLLTTAAGDTIFAFVQLWIPFNNMAVEFLAFAGFMMVVVVIFALMCIFYYEYHYYVGELPSDNDDHHAECFSESGESARRSIVSKGTFVDRF